MVCPHCRVDFHDDPGAYLLGEDRDGWWGVQSRTCSACKRFVLHLVRGEPIWLASGGFYGFTEMYERRLVRPKAASGAPAPSAVPDNIETEYTEAALILTGSPTASTALSRRCLQHI